MATIATDAHKIAIRTIAQEDAEEVAKLSGQLGYETSAPEMRQRIEVMLPLSESHLALVACRGHEVVGWIEAEIVRHLQSPAHTLITGLVVKDGVRSLGVGRTLCHETEKWSRDHGIPVLRVTSRMTRERAHQFYVREGFVQTKTSAVFEKLLSNQTD